MPITVLSKISGCLKEDTNRDGIENDGNLPLSNMPVSLYSKADLSTPLATALTDVNGEYLFDSLVAGQYFLKFAPPVEYKLPLGNTPLGNLVANDSLSDCINLASGITEHNCIVLGPCMPIDVSISQQTILRGEEACVTVTGAGDYVWSPNTDVQANGSTFKLSPSESTTYTVQSEGYYSCEDEAQFKVNVWVPHPSIYDPVSYTHLTLPTTPYV